MNTFKRQPAITSDDKGPLINILAIIFLITAFLTVLARIATKYSISRSLGWDDAAICGALALHAAQVAAIIVSASFGLGRHYTGLTSNQIRVFEKALYAAQLLLILVLLISKISVPIFLHHLTPREGHRKAALSLTLLISLWSVVSFVAVAAQCSPAAWDITDSKCFDQYAFWIFYTIMNILTELAIIALAALVLRRVQINGQRKLTIIGCFASRVLVVAAAICQAVFTTRPSSTVADPTFARWEAILCAVLVASLSLITACIPYVKSLYLNLESGMIRSDDMRRRRSSAATFKYLTVNHTHPSFISKPQPSVAGTFRRNSEHTLISQCLVSTGNEEQVACNCGEPSKLASIEEPVPAFNMAESGTPTKRDKLERTCLLRGGGQSQTLEISRGSS